jgi:hypothetical protein
MYRRGHKTKDMSHDLAAAKYWFDRARKPEPWQNYRPKTSICGAIDILCLCIEQERKRKWPDSTD